jgi:hypothetical protein
MWVGSIIYFVPFFFVLNPTLVLQGPSPYAEGLGHAALIGIGVLFICGGIQGYQSGIGDLRRAGFLEWPLRVALVAGGFVLAVPGGGVIPFTQVQIIGAALAILVPTLLLGLLLVRWRTSLVIPAQGVSPRAGTQAPRG